jgi:hypothetical protein
VIKQLWLRVLLALTIWAVLLTVAVAVGIVDLRG